MRLNSAQQSWTMSGLWKTCKFSYLLRQNVVLVSYKIFWKISYLSPLILVLHLSTSQQKFKEACIFCPLWSYGNTTIDKKLLRIRLRDFVMILFKSVRLPHQAMVLHFPDPKILHHCQGILIGRCRDYSGWWDGEKGNFSCQTCTFESVMSGMHISIVTCCVDSKVARLLGYWE